MHLKTHKLVFLFFLTISILSCTKQKVYEKYSQVGTSGWQRDNPQNFQFSISDTLERYNLFIQLRNTTEYEYSNLYLITELQYPSGFHTIDTLQYKMTDSFGNWLGSGYTDMKENKLFFRENFSFSEGGKYEINIQQATRKRGEIEGVTILKGISEVGFMIEKKD